MPKFAANLGFLFTELPFTDRIAAAAAAGFRGVEFPYPYTFGKAEIADKLRAHRLEQVLINSPRGRREGDRGLACDPDRRSEFEDSIGLALEYARALEAPRVHVVAGLVPPGRDRDSVLDVYMENIRHAGRVFGEHGITALVEAINTKVDAPGYFLNRPSEAARLVREMADAHVRLDFDFYHAQIMEGNLATLFTKSLDVIGHVQIADVPGRHEPGTGEINYPFLFEMIDSSGYTGWVGCEYTPKADTAESLRWIADYL
jgi:hydroxypyruvate isomerase